jgi:protein-disulfide isomerase
MKRYLPFAIILVVALVTAGVATTLYRSKMHPAAPATATGTAAAAAAPAPSAATAKEDESLHVRGPRTAPVTVEIYGDFQCPSCGIASAMIDDLLKQYGDQVRLIFHQFPLEMHNHAVEAAMAAEAAGLQGHFWEMHDMLYKYQSVWSRASSVSTFFAAYAESLGLDGGKFAIDAKSPEVQARVISEGDAGVARGVKNTPTFFINGREVLGGFRPENLKAAIDAALAEKKKS